MFVLSAVEAGEVKRKSPVEIFGGSYFKKLERPNEK
jgi:hypothetical protein